MPTDPPSTSARRQRLPRWLVRPLPWLLAGVLLVALLIPASARATTLRVSTAADRSDATQLDGSTLGGSVYIFVGPSDRVTAVRFWLDDPAMTGRADQVERIVPFDLRGTDHDDPERPASPLDTSRLAEGLHSVHAQVTTRGGDTRVISASFGVVHDQQEPDPTPHALRVSAHPDRASPAPLDGATVRGDIYAFASPAEDVERVTYHLDGSQVRVERHPPFDLGGTDHDDPDRPAAPLSTTRMDDGEHTVTADLRLTSGITERLEATFTVANDDGPDREATPTPSPTLQVSDSADRHDPRGLAGTTVTGDSYVFVAPATRIQQVEFAVDGRTVQTENAAAFDLAGTADTGAAHPYDTRELSDGDHTATALVHLGDGSEVRLRASFTVANDRGPEADTGTVDPEPTATEPAADNDTSTDDTEARPSRQQIVAGAGLSDPSRLEPADDLTVTDEGAVIENLAVDGPVTVEADDVTFRNVRFTYEGDAFAVRIMDGVDGTTFEHCEFAVSRGNAGIYGGTNRTVRHCEFTGHADGVKLHDGGLYEYNHIHMRRPAGSDKHLDGMQDSGDGSHLTIRHNVIDQPIEAGSNAAIILNEDFGQVRDVAIVGNYLNGGNYTVFVNGAQNIRIVDNAFGRGFRYGLLLERNADVTWRSNVWADTDEPARP